MRKFAHRQADNQTEILKTEATLSPVDRRGEQANTVLMPFSAQIGKIITRQSIVI